MDFPIELKKCACKGVRTCLICERPEVVAAKILEDPSITFYQCHRCGKLRKKEQLLPDIEATPLLVCGAGNCGLEKKIIAARKEAVELDKRWCSTVFEGVTVVKDFISPDEEREILSSLVNQTAPTAAFSSFRIGLVYETRFCQQLILTGGRSHNLAEENRSVQHSRSCIKLVPDMDNVYFKNRTMGLK